MVIGIIGAGASGMAAALAAAENPNNHVWLLERQARVGRKLLATGNGRCNLTNRNTSISHYHGEDSTFTAHALDFMPVEKTLDWFADLGLMTVCEPSGRVYPYSDQANSVVDVLRFALDRPNITVVSGFEVTSLKKEGEMFAVSNGQQPYLFQRVIIACGGLAGTKLGGSMSGYKLLGRFGHKSTRLRPALVQVKTDWPGITALKGVRANAHVQILHDGVFSESTGELQFTEYGLSGPVIFEVSRDACQGSGDWYAKIDFLPHVEKSILRSELERRKQTNLPVDELLTGILHNRLGRVITKSAGIRSGDKICDLSAEELDAICEEAKSFTVHLTEPLGMDSAQVTAGGVRTADFDPKTMESRLVPGLFACGEVLDVDGDCGGYNLQWAWSSGILAGRSAGKETV